MMYEPKYQEHDLVARARILATSAHEGQNRKYTGEPYINHPAAVADIIYKNWGSNEMVAAAWLHDTLEDTDTTYDQIKDACGEEVANLVVELTDVSKPSDGNRAVRKRMDKDRLAGASWQAQTIKLADLIDNSKSIVRYDPDFAKVYLKEKSELIEAMTKACSILRTTAIRQTNEALESFRALEGRND